MIINESTVKRLHAIANELDAMWPSGDTVLDGLLRTAAIQVCIARNYIAIREDGASHDHQRLT